MAKWEIALALLIAAALAHALSGLRQIRHYRDVFGELARRWPQARIGVGRARAGAGGEAIVIVVADRDGRVLAGRVRTGAGLFAKFRPVEAWVGATLDELGGSAGEDGVARALARAIGEIARPQDGNGRRNPRQRE